MWNRDAMAEAVLGKVPGAIIEERMGTGGIPQLTGAE